MKVLALLAALITTLVVVTPASSANVTPASFNTSQLKAMANAPGQPSTSVTSVATPTTEDLAVATATAITCWNNTQEHYQGTYPQQHNEIVFTHWCGTGSGGTITSRSTTVNGDVLFCSFNSWSVTNIGGGVGSQTVSIQADAYFSCPTGIPWLNLHFHEWMQIKYGAGGYVAILGQGG